MTGVKTDPLLNGRTAEPSPDLMTESYDQPDPTLVTPPPQTKRAALYSKKLAQLANTVMRSTIGNDATIADAATILLHGTEMSEVWGNLADKDARVRKVVDFITDQSENPWTAAILTTAPFVLQILRNHEPTVEPQNKVTKGFRIPFTKRRVRIPVRLRIKVPWLRNNTNDPEAVITHVLRNPDIAGALVANGITVAPSWAPLVASVTGKSGATR